MHPIMKGFEPFRTWDETYVHTKHNEKDRHVLQVRAEGQEEEPWTWVRTQGKGRIFYTAYGHDGRTWQNPGFHDLLERGIRWAVNKGRCSTAAGGCRPACRRSPTIRRPSTSPTTYRAGNGARKATRSDGCSTPSRPRNRCEHLVVPRVSSPGCSRRSPRSTSRSA